MSVKIKAKNPSNQLQTLLCDADGRLMVDAEVQIDNVGLATSALQGAGLPSALSSDNLRVSLKETITVPVSNAVLTSFDGAINSDKVDVNISSGNISGFATSALQAGGLPSALSSDSLRVSLKETITVPVSNGALTELESAINSNKVDVNISSGAITGFSTSALQGTTNGKLDSVVGELESILSSSQIISEGFTACDTGAVVISSSALPSGASTSALQRGGLPSALSSDSLRVSLKETITVPVSNAVLTSFDGAINSDRVDVNIANGGFDGAVSNAGLTALNGTIGLNKVNVNLSSDNVGLSTSALQGDTNTKLDTLDAQVDLLEGANTIKDVQWLSGATISDQSLSDVLDTEGYQNVFIYGENGGSISANSLKIFGSNTSGGTYYSVGQMSVITSDSGRYLIREDTPLADMPSPRYLKVFNSTGSTQTITTLRAVMSNKLRYV